MSQPDPSLRAGLEHLIKEWRAIIDAIDQGDIRPRVIDAYDQCADDVADLLRAQPPDWATTDAPGICGRGHTERQPKCPACHDMRIEAHGLAQPPPAPDPPERFTRPEDVTHLVSFDLPDEECLPFRRCVCGEEYHSWDKILTLGSDDPRECETCHRLLYWESQIRVFSVTASPPAVEPPAPDPPTEER